MRRISRRDARLCDIGEGGALKAIYRALGHQQPQVDAPGDDAALLSLLERNVVVSSDMLVEDKDFRLSWASYADIGAKAAMVNLSDLAAMGATPRGLLLSIALKKTTATRHLLALVRTAHHTGVPFGAPVVGGDLSEIDGPLVVSVTALGSLSGRPMLRHRARVGDVVCVTGNVGSAAAGLSILERPARYTSLPARIRNRLMQAQLRPQAPVALSPTLCASNLVRSAADVSDGLLADALHIAPPARASSSIRRAFLYRMTFWPLLIVLLRSTRRTSARCDGRLPGARILVCCWHALQKR